MLAWIKAKALVAIIVLWLVLIVLQFVLFGPALDLFSSLFTAALLFGYSKIEAIEGWLKGLKS